MAELKTVLTQKNWLKITSTMTLLHLFVNNMYILWLLCLLKYSMYKL